MIEEFMYSFDFVNNFGTKLLKQSTTSSIYVLLNRNMYYIIFTVVFIFFGMKWIETRPARPMCPVCKAAISKDKVIPIYGKDNPSQTDPR